MGKFTTSDYRFMPINPVLRRLRQEHHKLEASTGYTERTCVKNTVRN
jgi:hypothetical protein